MDIRNLTFRIKSCIACNENQCPVVKERLDQHVLSHEQHLQTTSRPLVSFKGNIDRSRTACNEDECPAMKERLHQHVMSHHSISNQYDSTRKSASKTVKNVAPTSGNPSVAIVNSDELTSTSNLAVEELKPINQPSYREALEREILKWAEDLPQYPNPSAENLKQNIINELIEKVDSLKSEIKESFYDMKLSNEVSKFLNSLPYNFYTHKRDSSMEILKLNLIYKICDLNKRTVDRTKNQNNYVFENKNINRLADKNGVTNTTEGSNSSYFKNNTAHNDNHWRNNTTTSIGTNTPQCAFDDRYKTLNRPEIFDSNNADDKKHMDAQVQNSFQNMRPYYGQIYGKPHLKINKQQKIEINEDICKEKISTWLINVIHKSERNLEQNDKKILTDVLFNRLRPLLTKHMYSAKHKLLLKAEILNFLYDYFMVAVATNGTHFNKLVENLAVALLIEKTNNEVTNSKGNTYSYYCTNERIGYEVDTECYYRPIFYKTVTDALENVITRSDVENDISEILLYNIDRLRLGFNEDIKRDLHVLLKSSTDLCGIAIADIVNVIIDKLTGVICNNLDNYNSIQNLETPPGSNILSVYKSELELRGPPKISAIYRISDVIKKNEPKLNLEEREYKEQLSAIISAWLKTLPNKRYKAEDIIIKEKITNSLTVDIIDQVKLEAVAPETWNEKEKYFSFFIYRWLNRFEYFDDIINAKPYVDNLLKKIIDIPFTASGSQQKKNIHKITRTISCSQGLHIPVEVIEDEISRILNAQPSEIFINRDKEIRNQQVHEFALDIQNSFEDASKDITKKINEGLTKIIIVKKNKDSNLIKDHLIERLNSLREGILNYHNQDRLPNIIKGVQYEKVTSACCQLRKNYPYNPEYAFKEFIAKFIEHNYDVENPIARQAFGEILKIELQRLSAPTKNDGYNNFIVNEQYVMTTLDTLYRELKYINIISDWLKTLPVPTRFNSSGNRSRVEFVNCLAKNLSDVYERRLMRLSQLEYEVCLASIINQFADQLTIPRHLKKSMTAIVDDLVQKIVKIHPRLCCQIANCKKTITSINSTNIPDEQLSKFIEEYIRDNCEELSEDELKQEAMSVRLFKEIDKMRSENLGPLEGKEDEKRDEPVRRLSFELGYVKEITEYLNNLPLLPIDDQTSRNTRIKLISNLAEKMYERWQALYYDPNNTYVNTILSEYILQWLSELPLEPSKEIDDSIVIQQLINRMERFNRQKLDTRAKSHLEKEDYKLNELCKFPYTCCNKSSTSLINQDFGAAIIEAIEKWCAELPVQIDDETNNNKIKDYIATKLFKKIYELNMNPKCFKDNNLYGEILSEEIDEQLSNLLLTPTSQIIKEDLKHQLVSTIMDKRNKIKEQAASTEYKQELEKTIDSSFPNPLQTYQEEGPSFKIYKDRLATLFILENFDHGYDDFKENYEKILKREIEKYFQSAQKRNAIPLTKEQIYNELYSALFEVPLPNEASIAEEVEEIKTRCEINNWFTTLPLKAASCDGEVLARDQIMATLAKRIHKMEKYEQNSDSKIHKEIVKWLFKLPLFLDQGNKVDELARTLLQRLKSTVKKREYTPRNENVYIDKFIMHKNKKKSKRVLGTSQIAGPSNENKVFPCPVSPTCCQTTSSTSTKSAELIMNIVEMWCQQLPLSANTPLDKNNVQLIKNNLITKIIMKISELNINPDILNNDFLYDALLDDELENLLSSLPTSDILNQSKELRKNHLKDGIKSVKPLIQKERVKYEYRQGLQNIVDMYLKEPQIITSKISALSESLKDNIIDYFILYSYHKNNEEGSFCKMMVNVAIEKYFTEVCHIDDNLYNPLMVRNRLLCEMSKVAAPSIATFLEEIKEIRIKFKVTKFFDNHSLCKRHDKLLIRKHIISTLAKRLNELEKNSNTSGKGNIIKNEIVKCFKKLEENVQLERIESLVSSIQNLPEEESSVASECKYVNSLQLMKDNQRHDQNNIYIPDQQQNLRYDDHKQNIEDASLFSVIPNVYDASNITHDGKANLENKQSSQFGDQRAHSNIKESKTKHSDLKNGIVLTSSIREDQESNNYKNFSLETNKKTESDYFCCKSDVVNQRLGPSASEQVAKPFTPYLQGHLKITSNLSEQDSTFVQDINMQQSNSVNNTDKVANKQQSISPSKKFTSPTRLSVNQQNRTGQSQTMPEFAYQIPNDSSMPDYRVKRFPPSNQSMQNKNSRQPIGRVTHQKVLTPVTQPAPQQLCRRVKTRQDKNPKPIMQNVSGLAKSNIHTNQSNAFNGSMHSKHEKTIASTTSSDNEERNRLPNFSSTITITKLPKNIKNMRKPSSSSILSQSSSSTTHLTPRRPISDSNVQCQKRKPSILSFKPSDMISKSISSQCSQTVERKIDSISSNIEGGSIKCKCGKRNRLCSREMPNCRAHNRKRCRICVDLSPFYCKMPPCHYPGFYYY